VAKLVKLDGELITRIEYCKRLGYSYSAIASLIYRKGLDFDDAVNQYLANQQRKLECLVHLGKELISMKEYCRRKGYSYKAITALMYRYNLTFEEAIYRYNAQRKTKCQRLRNIWRGMRHRCYDINEPAYKLYGERGIIVQDSWKDNYFNFEDDLYDSYIKHVKEYGEKDTTLDRIDYNGNYELSNVRWATRKEQANNRRTNFIVVDNLTLAQFSEKYNLPATTVWQRIHNGWTINDIINTPIEKSKKYYLPCGKLLNDHCVKNNYNYNSITYYCRRYNLSPHEALAKYLENKQKKNK